MELMKTTFAALVLVFCLSAGAALTNHNTLYVDLNGSDSTGKKGLKEFPFKSGYAASLVAQPGDTIFYSPGVFRETNWIKCPTNGAIIGSGAGSTLLIDAFTNGSPTPMIVASDGGYVSDLTISNLYNDSALEIFGSCIGTHQNLAQVSGNAVVAGAGGYTNFLVERCVLYGGSDTYYNRHTNNCYGTVKYSKLYGPWDIVTAFNVSTQRYEFWYCDFIHAAVSTHANAKDIFIADSSPRATFKAYFCNFYKTNGIQGDDYFVNLFDTSKQRADFYYCNFTNANPGATKFNTQGTAAAPFTFVNCNVNMAEVGDDASTSTGLTLGTNTAQAVVLGGDSANGNIVSLWSRWPAANELLFSRDTILRGNGGVFTNAITSQSANYAILTTDSLILLNGNLTATLPTAVGIPGKTFTITCKTSGTNGILTTSAQTLLGYGSTAATKWTNSVVGRSTTVVSDGANWVVLKSDN